MAKPKKSGAARAKPKAKAKAKKAAAKRTAKRVPAKSPPKKKPAPKPKASAKPATKSPRAIKSVTAKGHRHIKTPESEIVHIRGSGLVELAIATDRERRTPSDPPHPLSSAQIAQLTMPDGRDIPPSLATWLAYDTLDIFEDGSPLAPRLRWRSFLDMLREQFDDQTAAMYVDFGKVLTGGCLAIPHGSDSRGFIYAGEPDGHGEYPVFVVDTDELPWVGLAYPGFDAYIADGRVAKAIANTYLDAWESEHWVPHLEHHARQNFRGLKALDYQDPEHVDGDAAARIVIAEILGPIEDAVVVDVDDAGDDDA